MTRIVNTGVKKQLRIKVNVKAFLNRVLWQNSKISKKVLNKP